MWLWSGMRMCKVTFTFSTRFHFLKYFFLVYIVFICLFTEELPTATYGGNVHIFIEIKVRKCYVTICKTINNIILIF